MRKADPIKIEFRNDELANLFWWIDQASRFDPELTRPEQRAALEKQAALSPAEKQALEAYAKLRRKKSDPAIDEPGPPRLDALPPKLSAAEAFAAPFLSQTKLADAIRDLNLAPKDAATVSQVFRVIGPRIKKHHAAVNSLETARGKLIQLSEPERLQRFAGLVADFYGVRTHLEAGLVVQLVSQPEGHLRATQVGPVLLIPITPGSLNSTRLQVELLGIIVHELSHHMASQVSDTVRDRVTRDVEGYLGLPNQKHENIFDEATQTAIGNIVFMKRNFPTAYDPDGKFYAYEPNNDFPYAIDSYARALAPHLERLLAMPGGFAGPYLRAAIQEHAALFPRVVRHHTRVVSVLSENRRAQSSFVGLFAAQSRLRHVGDDVVGFLKETQGSNAPRFVIGRPQWAQRNRKALSAFDPTLGAVLGALDPERADACLGARFNPKRGSWDFVVLGSEGAVRRLLVNVHRGMPVPAGKPACTR